MAKRRSKRRKKNNPSTGAWIALGIGAAAAVGLVGYGIYKHRQTSEPMLEGAAGELTLVPWGYRILPTGPGLFTAQIFVPGGGVHLIPNQATHVLAAQHAQAYITAQGGTPFVQG